jgi:hypothetical protein
MKYKAIIAFMLIICASGFAQINQYTSYGTRNKAVHWIDNNNNVQYNLSPNYTVGKLIGSWQTGSTDDRYRMCQEFDITSISTLPDLDIMSVKMYVYSYQSSNYTFKVIVIDTYGYGAQEIFDAANIGTELYPSLNYQTMTYTDGAILQAVRDVYNGYGSNDNKLRLGLVSQNESTDNTAAIVYVDKLVITYRNKYTNPRLQTDYGQDPNQGVGDFEVDNQKHTSPWYPAQDSWLKDEDHFFHSYDHSDITYSVDSRPYDRTPKDWVKQELAYTPISHTGSDWTTSVHEDDSPVFTAFHYRYVDNEFQLRTLTDNQDIANVEMTIDNTQRNSGYVQRKKNGSAFNFDADTPFSFFDNGNSKTYYFTGWYIGSLDNFDFDAYGNFNQTTGQVGRSISPDLHHKDHGGGDDNSYIGSYNCFSISSFDTGLELPYSYISASTPTVSNSHPAVSVTVPATISYSNIEYVFVGWEYGGMGTLNGTDYTITLEFGNNNGVDYSKAMRGLYKAHLISTDQFGNTTSEGATCPQSQRKLDWVQTHGTFPYGPDGLYQLVYHSGGKIWYTKSTDKGYTWDAEKTFGLGTSPCISAGINKQQTDKAYMVWNSHNHDALVCLYPLGPSYTWSYTLSSTAMPSDGAPVISYDQADSLYVVIWEREQDGRIGYAVVYRDNENWPYCSSKGFIQNSGQVAPVRKPSICASYPGFHISWIENDVILHSYINVCKYNNPTRIYVNVLDPDTTSNTFYSAIGSPSISVDNTGYPAIAWG